MFESKLRFRVVGAIALSARRRWTDQVLQRSAKRLSRLASRHSLAGNDLLDRARSTTFAMLGVTAAVALGLVALIAQQGWPLLPLGPIVGPSSGRVAVGEARIVRAHRAPIAGAARRPGTRGAVGGARHRGAAAAEPARSNVSGAHQLAVAPPPSQTGGSQPPAPGPTAKPPAAPGPSATPAAPPATAPTSTPATPSAPAQPSVTATAASTSTPPEGQNASGNGDNPYGRYGSHDHSDEHSDSRSGGQSGTRGGGYRHRSPTPTAPPAQVEEPIAEPEGKAAPPSEESQHGHGHDHGYGYGSHGYGPGH